MKNIFVISIVLGFALIFNQSCETNGSNHSSELLDSAKAKFVQFDNLPNSKRNQSEDLLNESIRILQDIKTSEPNNPEANYYLGYALDQKYNNYVDILNFELINYRNTDIVSKLFQESIKDTNYSPDYKLSQYSYLTNIWGRLALNYLVKGLPDSAKFAFSEGKKRGGYTSANLEYASNLLTSLAPNAILIVNTNLEAYSLWYLQYFSNFRPDVSVVNYSYLAYQWYAKWISFPLNLTNPIQTNLDNNTLQAAYSNAIITVSDTVVTIKNQKSSLYPKVKSDITTTLKGVGRNEAGILLPIAERMSFVIITTNIWQRPIYFSSNTAKFLPYSIGLSQYSKLEGLVARLYPESIPLSHSVNGDKCLELLNTQFKLEKFQEKQSYRDRDLGFIATNYRFMYLQTMYYFADYPNKGYILEQLQTQFNSYFPEFYFPRTKEEIVLFNKIKSTNSVQK